MKLAAKMASMAAIMALGLAACGGEPEPEPEPIDMSTPEGAMRALESMANSNGNATASGPMKVYTDGMDDIADAISRVDNEASARQAAHRIAEVAKDMEGLQAEFDSMSDAEKTAAAMANAQAITQSGTRVAAAMMTLQTQHPELMEIISEEMDKIPDMN